jgi:hypothetical protein
VRGEELNFAFVEPADDDVVLGGGSLYDVGLEQSHAAVGYWLAPSSRPWRRDLRRPATRSTDRGHTGPTGRRRRGQMRAHHIDLAIVLVDVGWL